MVWVEKMTRILKILYCQPFSEQARRFALIPGGVSISKRWKCSHIPPAHLCGEKNLQRVREWRVRSVVSVRSSYSVLSDEMEWGRVVTASVMVRRRGSRRRCADAVGCRHAWQSNSFTTPHLCLIIIK